MEDKKEKAKEECCSDDSCCSDKGGCGCGGGCSCGGGSCNCFKGLIIVMLFLLGGVIGYLIGNGHCGKKMCGMMNSAPCPMTEMHQAPMGPK